MENTRTTLEDHSSNEDGDCFRDSYATSLPYRRPYKLNMRKENLMYKFEEEYEVDKPDLIQVYLRLKPSDMLNAAYEIRSDKCLVTSMDTATMGHGRRTQQIVKKMYTFSHIFGPDSYQKEVFETVVKMNLQRLSEGHNYTLLTYGASGSGKTYTLMGTKTAPGLIPRSLEYLFHIVEASQSPYYRPFDNGTEKLSTVQQYQELMWVEKLRQVSAPARKKYRRMSANLTAEFSASTLNLSNRIRYYIWVSFIEIYNEVIYDLLVPPDSRSKLYIMSDSNGQEYVKGARQAFVRSGEEAHDVLVAGRHNLRVASTGVNAQSSRSHCIFTITMITETADGVRISRMRLCDLAGSERANRTQNKGVRMAESGAINSSLHVLERCLMTLRKNQRQRQPDAGFVPYRQSKLTRLLCSGLSGSCGEAFGLVVTLSQELDCVLESKRVLQVTAVAKDIQINNTVIGSSMGSTSSHLQDTFGLDELEKLRSENERLSFELAQKESESKELRALLEKRRLESAELMQRLVKEAKDMTHEYHTALTDGLKQRHAEEIDSIKQSTAAEINQLLSENAQLLTENAQLREQLVAERVARTIDLEELQYLRGLIEEADQEKQSTGTTPKPKDYEPMLSDSEKDENGRTATLHNAACHDSYNERSCQSTSGEIDNADDRTSTASVSTVSDEDFVINVDSDDDITRGGETHRSGIIDEGVVNGEREAEDGGVDVTCNIDNASCVKDASTNCIEDGKNDSNSDCDKNSLLRNATDANDLSKQTFSEEGKFEASSISKISITSSIRNNGDRSPKLLQTEFENMINVMAINDNSKTPSAPPAQTEESLKSSEIENERTIKNGFEIKKDQNQNANSAASNTYNTEVLEQSRQEKITDSDHYRSVSQCKKELHADIEMKSDFSEIKNKLVIDNNDECNLGSEKKEEIVNLKSIAPTQDNKESFASSGKSTKMTKGNNDFFPRNNATISPKITRNLKNVEVDKSNESSIRCTILNSSLAQFERFENAMSDRKLCEDVDSLIISFTESHTTKEKKIYFDNLDATSVNNTSPKLTIMSEAVVAEKNYTRIHPIEETIANSRNDISEVKTHSRSNILESKDYCFTKPKPIACSNKHGSVDIFEEFGSPVVKHKTIIEQNEKIKENSKTEEKLQCRLDVQEHQQEIIKITPVSMSYVNTQEVAASFTKRNTAGNNTTEEFENLYRDVSTSNISEFNALLMNENINTESVKGGDFSEDNNCITNISNDVMDNLKVNGEKNTNMTNSVKDVLERTFGLGETKRDDEDMNHVKYNLRERSQQREEKPERSQKTKAPKYNLRLRRQKNLNFEAEPEDPNKLQDIVNLQKQFSDVTLDISVEMKPEQDIAFLDGEPQGKENFPLETQSCPQKSITRSRRKLYTPREPLEDSFVTGESDDRVKIPRPSYHKGRARRRL